ncbi:MAG: protein kinase [Deltaproteobacteria bacterium]|nr:protein kinase [Deltaproteobacteria bacterium]
MGGQPRLAPGDLFAERFEIRRQAGAGGMSLVYAARDRESGQVVALKVLHGDRASAARFVREVWVLSELHHPAIVRYVAHGTTADGQAWLAMEWLDGEDLAERLARAPLTAAETVVLAERVAGALAVAHARGIVHRDIKPSNLFLPEGRIDHVKVLDFGVARLGGGEQLTQTNTRIGTPAYMSPEQARGRREVGAPSDVFSLGVVLWQALAGHKPFVGDDAMAVIARILLADPPPLREVAPRCPAALEALIARMLEKDPHDRPADGAALAHELALIHTEAIDAEVTTGPIAIGPGEHRLTCLILAAEVGDDHAAVDAVAAIAAAVGARAEPMADGSIAVLLTAQGVATDLATAGARCALAVRAAVPHAPIALATGRAVVGRGGQPVGEVIDRAVALLRARADASDDGPYVRDSVPFARVELSPGETHLELATSTGVITPIESPRVRPTGRPAGSPPPVLIDAITAGLLDARFDIGGVGRGPGPLGGDAPLALRGERERDPIEVGRTLLGKPTPFVAREAELAAIEGAYAAAVDEPAARVVLVTAPAGVGKTRLRQELVARLARRDPAPLVLLGRGDPSSAGAPFGVLAHLVRREVGMRDGESDATQRGKLRARVGRHLADPIATRAAEFLGEMVGARFDDADRIELRAARADKQLLGDQIRQAWQDWLAAECAAGPVVLVIEDLHWGDLPSVNAIELALRNLREAPLVVLATARPDVHERFPQLWAERGVTELRLGELGRRACERLVAAALGAATPAPVVARLIERAAGNALFLEELIRASAVGQEDPHSPTVVAMVQARLEAMETEARRVLRAASVFGEVFWAGGVEAVIGAARGGADAWLAALVEREVLIRRGDGRVRGEIEYGFRHALVRDAAHAMLTPDDRALAHRLAGQWLEAKGDRDPVRLAEHWERGAMPARAAAWWRRAAERALAASDLDGVLEHARRAIGCGATGALLGAVRALAAEAHDWRGEFAEAERAARDAMRWLGKDDLAWFTAAGILATAAGVQGKSDALDELSREVDLGLATLDEPDPDGTRLAATADRAVIAPASEAAGVPAPAPAIAPHHDPAPDPDDSGLPTATDAREALAATRLAEQLIIHGRTERADQLLARLGAVADDAHPGVAGRVHAVRALRARFAGDVARNLAEVERAAACFDRAGDRRNACVRRERLGYAHLELGQHALAERTLTDAMTTAQQLGLRNVVATARHNLGLVLSRLGRHAQARAVEEEAVIAFRASRNRRMEGASLEYLALILLAAGDLAAAEAAGRQALAVASAPPVLPLNQAEAWSILARILLARGSLDEAARLAIAGVEQLERLGGIDDGEAFIRLTHADALRAVGRIDEADAILALARARLRERADRIADPALRASFLREVPENAQTLGD